tara:strand:+ start:754 stop:1008 length:255 start_codon:yes stop_codon:yes gene_type:complete
MSIEFNFIHPNVSSKDRDIMGFDDENIMIEDGWIMAHIMHKVGIFPSVGQARKNGWDKPIQPGFSEFTVGKMKKKVFILNEIQD